MRVLLLLAALASPPATPAQPQAPPQSAQDVRKGKPLPMRNDDRRIQIQPAKPNPEGKAGPGIG